MANVIKKKSNITKLEVSHGYALKKGKNRINNGCSERGEACLQGVEVTNVIDGTIYYE